MCKVTINSRKINSPLVECLQHDAKMFFEVSVRHHENLVAFPCYNLENYFFYGDQSQLYFLVIFEILRFQQNLKNGSITFLSLSPDKFDVINNIP